MKVGLIWIVGALATAAASPIPSPAVIGRVVERGPNTKVVEVTRATTNQLGQVVQTTNLVTVLGQGMHYKDASGQWVESQYNEDVDGCWLGIPYSESNPIRSLVCKVFDGSSSNEIEFAILNMLYTPGACSCQ